MKLSTLATATLLASCFVATAALADPGSTSTGISTEALPGNDPSLRHNPVAIPQSAAATKSNLQPEATHQQLHEREAYFDFNRSDLHTEDLPMLRVHANYLLSHPDKKVELVGHADQRGDVAYNTALGNERARSVRKYFLTQGIPADRIKIVSEGRVDPATSENTEPAMATYRRVDIVYL